MATYLATVDHRALQGHALERGRDPVICGGRPAEARPRRPCSPRPPAILRLYSRTFGDYPFGQTGAIVDSAPRWATRSRPRPDPSSTRAPDQVTLAHELAHQWFGDAVTPRRWRDIWLNEGFATWSEWYWDPASTAARRPGRRSDSCTRRPPATPASGTHRPADPGEPAEPVRRHDLRPRGR